VLDWFLNSSIVGCTIVPIILAQFGKGESLNVSLARTSHEIVPSDESELELDL